MFNDLRGKSHPVVRLLKAVLGGAAAAVKTLTNNEQPVAPNANTNANTLQMPFPATDHE